MILSRGKISGVEGDGLSCPGFLGHAAFALQLSAPDVDRTSRALNGIGETVEYGFRFLEPEACIGDTLTIGYRGILTARDKVALDHERANRRTSQVLHDRISHVDLPVCVLVAVAVAAVNHEDLGKMSGAK